MKQLLKTWLITLSAFVVVGSSFLQGQVQKQDLQYLPSNANNWGGSKPVQANTAQGKKGATNANPSQQLVSRPAGGSSRRLADGRIHLSYGKVKLIKKIEVPALVSGPLTQFYVFQGDTVQNKFLLAIIDNQKAQTKLETAKARLKAAQTQIDSDVAVRYAQASYETAKKIYERDSRLARRDAVSREEAEKSRLEMIQAQLQVDKAKHDRVVDQEKIEVERFNVQEANEEFHRHKVVASFGGLIGKIHKHQGEWVNAGDTILELLHMDELWVEAKVSGSVADPYELVRKPVQVQLKLANGKTKTIAGSIVFVDVEKDGTGNFSVRAKIANQRIQGHWLLLPGGNVSMDVFVKKPAVVGFRNSTGRRSQ